LHLFRPTPAAHNARRTQLLIVRERRKHFLAPSRSRCATWSQNSTTRFCFCVRDLENCPRERCGCGRKL